MRIKISYSENLWLSATTVTLAHGPDHLALDDHYSRVAARVERVERASVIRVSASLRSERGGGYMYVRACASLYHCSMQQISKHEGSPALPSVTKPN